MNESEIVTGEFNIKIPKPILRVFNTSDDNKKEVIINTTVEGSTIYYTENGSNPTELSSVYNGEVLQLSSGKTIKAAAVKPEMIESDVITAKYGQKVERPIILPGDGIYPPGNVEITINSATDGSTIYYRVDEYFLSFMEGFDFNITEPIKYTAPFSIEITDNLRYKISAIAIKDGMINSDTLRINPRGSSFSNHPYIQSFDPDKWSSAVGEFRSFTLTIGDPDGSADINLNRISIRFKGHGTTNLTADVICFEYKPPDEFHVWIGETSQFSGFYTFGEEETIDINNCLIDVAKCHVVTIGNTISLTYCLKPKSAFIADPTQNPKKIWCWVQDKHQNAEGSYDHNLVWEVGSWLIKDN